jgi:phosphoribosyl-AMP cyclohydrolase
MPAGRLSAAATPHFDAQQGRPPLGPWQALVGAIILKCSGIREAADAGDSRRQTCHREIPASVGRRLGAYETMRGCEHPPYEFGGGRETLRQYCQMTQGAETGPDFAKAALLPAIAQDAETGEVLMLGYMNAESYAQTLACGQAVYFSRSRNKLWRKGEQSGNVQEVQAIYLDCDRDTILLMVRQSGGAACHQGYRSCFYRKVTPEGLQVVGERVFDPDKVYGKQ